MKTVSIILWVLLAILVASGLILAVWIRRAARRFSRAAFGVDSLKEGLESQKELLESTPKSVSGMTRIYLPQIQEDFPEFSFPEFVSRSENQLKACLMAVDQQRLMLPDECSGDLRKQIALWIEDNRQQGIREQFQNIIIHQTEITTYKKTEGSCLLVLQSALEYRHAILKTGENPPELERVQTRYNQEWMYVQDVDKLEENTTAVGVCCPNCGAPVKTLGQKACEYCHAALEPVNIRVWALNRIREV